MRRLDGDAAVFGLALALSFVAHGGVLAGFLLLPSELPPRPLTVMTVELVAGVEMAKPPGPVEDEAADAAAPPPGATAAATDVREELPAALALRQRPVLHAQAPDLSPPEPVADEVAAAVPPPPPTPAAAATDVREEPPVAPAPHRRPLPYAQAPHPSPPAAPTTQIAAALKPSAAIAPLGAGARQAVAAVAPRYTGGGIANPPPRYPYMARRRGQEGQVLLRVRVTADGNAAMVRVRRSSGYPLLDAAAATAVRSWRFHAASHGGRPVAGVVDVPVAFTLTD